MRKVLTLATIALLAVASFALYAAFGPSEALAAFAPHADASLLGLAVAGHMAISHIPGAKGIIAIRADANDPAALFKQINAAFEEFKATNDKRLKEIEAKGSADALTTEKVEKINAEITRLSNELRDVMAKANRPALSPEADAQAEKRLKAFNASLRAHALRLGRQMPAALDADGYRNYVHAFGEFLRAPDTRALAPEIRNALVVGEDPKGGYVCPPEIDMSIDRVVQQFGAMRQLATVRTIGAASFKKLAQTSGAGFGGWGNETTAPSETTTPGLVELEFVPGTMWAEPRGTAEMFEDSVFDAEGWLADEVGITFGEQEGQAYVTGNGVNRPRGFQSYTIVANASYSWGNVGYIATGGASGFASSNPSDALIDLQHALKRQYRGGAVWMMNDATLGTIRKFKDGNGIYLWAPSGLLSGVVGQLLGHPVETDDFMPDLGANAYPVAFGDFRRGYLIVDRRGTVVLRDPYTSKPYVKFYTTRRVGGGIQNFEAIKLLKCAAS